MKKLKKFEFKASAAKSKYDWDAILNGDINQLTNPDDFASTPGAFGAMCRYKAAMQYKKIRLSIEGQTVTVQAYDMNGEERDAEDTRRAKSEASFKARVEKKKAEKAAAKNGTSEEATEPELAEEVAA